MTAKVVYYMIFAPNSKDACVVRAVYDNAQTRVWNVGDRGFSAAKARAKRANTRR